MTRAISDLGIFGACGADVQDVGEARPPDPASMRGRIKRDTGEMAALYQLRLGMRFEASPLQIRGFADDCPDWPWVATIIGGFRGRG
jgi:hypothetical protein